MKLDIKDLDKLQDGIQDLVQKGMQAGVDGLNKGLDYINNLDPDGKPKTDGSGFSSAAGTEDAPAICTQCGAKLDLNTDADVVVCEYCGASYNKKKSGAGNTVKTILDFVEKQQTIQEEKAERARERLDREREEKHRIKLEKLKSKRQKRLIRLPIIIIILAIIYSYIKTRGIDISGIISNIQNIAGF